MARSFPHRISFQEVHTNPRSVPVRVLWQYLKSMTPPFGRVLSGIQSASVSMSGKHILKSFHSISGRTRRMAGKKETLLISMSSKQKVIKILKAEGHISILQDTIWPMYPSLFHPFQMGTVIKYSSSPEKQETVARILHWQRRPLQELAATCQTENTL